MTLCDVLSFAGEVSMAEKTLNLDDVLPLVLRLAPLDKVKLVERIASALEGELLECAITEQSIPSSSKPKGWGAKLVKAIESGEIDISEWVSDEEIEEARGEMWQNIPHDDFAKEIPSPSAPSIHETQVNQGWGASVVELLNSLDTSEWEQIEMPDVVAWLKDQRREQDRRRRLHWNVDK
jgi:hypothetical protein